MMIDGRYDWVMSHMQYFWNIRNVIKNGNTSQRKRAVYMVLEKEASNFQKEFIPDLLRTLSDRNDDRFNLELKQIISTQNALDQSANRLRSVPPSITQRSDHDDDRSCLSFDLYDSEFEVTD